MSLVFTASTVGSPPVAAITATRRWIRSAANTDNRSRCLPSDTRLRRCGPSAIAGPHRGPVERRPTACVKVSADWKLRNPITGIAPCCARAPKRPRPARRAAEQRDELPPPNVAHGPSLQPRRAICDRTGPPAGRSTALVRLAQTGRQVLGAT